jgi:hypothetical protein
MICQERVLDIESYCVPLGLKQGLLQRLRCEFIQLVAGMPPDISVENQTPGAASRNPQLLHDFIHCGWFGEKPHLNEGIEHDELELSLGNRPKCWRKSASANGN